MTNAFLLLISVLVEFFLAISLCHPVFGLLLLLSAIDTQPVVTRSLSTENIDIHPTCGILGTVQTCLKST
ncbi:hypothetical protein Y032_0020g44 [Ancylostoma ceylanicum]|uniref:Uncharacterized protein n=1 Tax=Ancylostoma ceylanicum TaxID=53326 RepID=A0A016V1Q6_9BILA|nr:hypothetical protein Y032_0020g44 [Ancylostoma ceylanicum]